MFRHINVPRTISTIIVKYICFDETRTLYGVDNVNGKGERVVINN